MVRCLTVDVSVTTPRNENQEAAYKTAVEIFENLNLRVTENPLQCETELISYLNACLAEPISNNINLRFQDKILSCTADDQKLFRKRLQDMLDRIREPANEATIDLTNSCSTESSSQTSVQNGIDLENGSESVQSDSDTTQEGS